VAFSPDWRLRVSEEPRGFRFGRRRGARAAETLGDLADAPAADDEWLAGLRAEPADDAGSDVAVPVNELDLDQAGDDGGDSHGREKPEPPVETDLVIAMAEIVAPLTEAVPALAEELERLDSRLANLEDQVRARPASPLGVPILDLTDGLDPAGPSQGVRWWLQRWSEGEGDHPGEAVPPLAGEGEAAPSRSPHAEAAVPQRPDGEVGVPQGPDSQVPSQGTGAEAGGPRRVPWSARWR
jgi:hypothetical protein